jgi:hypothetical protein
MLKSLPASISHAVASGVGKQAEAQAAADHLAAIMSDINGGDWRVSIDHENAFILICQDFDEPVETVDSGENL